MIWYALLIAAVAVERVAELVVSQRNLAWSRARGGVEFGARHYPAMVVLHTGLLAGCLVEALYRPFVPALGWPMLAVVLAAQGLRWWCIATLGRQWNTRVVVIPDAARVTSGPYRFFSHPNYVAVVVEGIALPLVHTAWVTAVVFTVLNAVLLRNPHRRRELRTGERCGDRPAGGGRRTGRAGHRDPRRPGRAGGRRGRATARTRRQGVRRGADAACRRDVAPARRGGAGQAVSRHHLPRRSAAASQGGSAGAPGAECAGRPCTPGCWRRRRRPVSALSTAISGR